MQSQSKKKLYNLREAINFALIGTQMLPKYPKQLYNSLPSSKSQPQRSTTRKFNRKSIDVVIRFFAEN